MKTELPNLLSELQVISDDAQKTFGNFSAAQINWKPSVEGWSIGQCIEHLIKTNELFYNDLEKIADGSRQKSFLENYSPLSSFFGNLLVNSLKKDERKFKAPTQKIVPPSEIDENIVEIFAAHQVELIGKIKTIEKAEWQKIKITSPFMKFMTYKLADGFQIVVEHEKRHFRQAARVTKTADFPNE
jgi:hypothetical protein